MPLIINRNTLFARVQQFAGRLYGPLIAYGLAWWHGADSNYWGHNAVLRTAAFAQSAGLPTLGGPRPIGGHILSHDFVEAALMWFVGWVVVMAPALPSTNPSSTTEGLNGWLHARRAVTNLVVTAIGFSRPRA